MSLEDFQKEVFDYADLLVEFYFGNKLFQPVNKLQKWLFRNVENIYNKLDLVNDEIVSYEVTEKAIYFKTRNEKSFLVYLKNDKF